MKIENVPNCQMAALFRELGAIVANMDEDGLARRAFKAAERLEGRPNEVALIARRKARKECHRRS